MRWIVHLKVANKLRFSYYKNSKFFTEPNPTLWNSFVFYFFFASVIGCYCLTSISHFHCLVSDVPKMCVHECWGFLVFSLNHVDDLTIQFMRWQTTATVAHCTHTNSAKFLIIVLKSENVYDCAFLLIYEQHFQTFFFQKKTFCTLKLLARSQFACFNETNENCCYSYGKFGYNIISCVDDVFTVFFLNMQTFHGIAYRHKYDNKPPELHEIFNHLYTK